MKEFAKFLNEEQKKKKEEAKKPHAVKKGEGADDKKYLALMSEYKLARREDPKGAAKLLRQAQSLKDVSRNAKVAAAYF
jgi:hypothetical protein